MTAAPSNALADDSPLLARRSLAEEARFDITAMVDLVFMMNIFFLVTWVGASMAEVDLPAASHCVAVDTDTSVIVTVTGDARRPATVYLADGTSGEALTDPAQIDQKIRELAEAGIAESKNSFIIKAEKGVRLREVARVAAAAGSVEGTKLHLAVIEKE